MPARTPVAGVKVTPEGRAPVTDSVGRGKPVAATVNEPAEPSVKLVLLPLVMLGARLIVMLKLCVASGSVPFVAVTTPLYVPMVVGVPERTPADVKLSPGGNEPGMDEKVIGAVPVAV